MRSHLKAKTLGFLIKRFQLGPSSRSPKKEALFKFRTGKHPERSILVYLKALSLGLGEEEYIRYSDFLITVLGTLEVVSARPLFIV